MPQQPRPAATSTNRRYSYPAPETPVEPLCDVPLIRRVRDGLHRLDTDRNNSVESGDEGLETADSTRLGLSSI